jgi:hypothetical protein
MMMVCCVCGGRRRSSSIVALMLLLGHFDYAPRRNLRETSTMVANAKIWVIINPKIYVHTLYILNRTSTSKLSKKVPVTPVRIRAGENRVSRSVVG